MVTPGFGRETPLDVRTASPKGRLARGARVRVPKLDFQGIGSQDDSWPAKHHLAATGEEAQAPENAQNNRLFEGPRPSE